jgi:hypothetical protein
LFSRYPISSPIQDAEARKLPYLQAVIKEGLRIFPPVVGLMSKVVPPEGDVIDNLFVQEGQGLGTELTVSFEIRKYGVKTQTHFVPRDGSRPCPRKQKRWN